MDSTLTSPSSPKASGLNFTSASGTFGCGASRKLNTARMEDCITAVPMLPGEAPMMPVGFRANELAPQGRDPQSMASFRARPSDEIADLQQSASQNLLGDCWVEAIKPGRPIFGGVSVDPQPWPSVRYLRTMIGGPESARLAPPVEGIVLPPEEQRRCISPLSVCPPLAM